MKKQFIGFGAGVLMALATVVPSQAAMVDVTSLGVAAFDTWLDGTFSSATRNGGATGIVASPSPDGDGAASLTSPDGSGKATIQYFGSTPLGALSDLTGIGYSWYRDGTSTNPAAQAPGLKIFVNDGAGRSGTLIYEPVYNGVPVAPTDAWQTVDATAGNWWLFEGGVFEVYNLTLASWATDAVFAGPGGSSKQGFGANAQVTGIEVGIGSGWNGVSTYFTDLVNISFNGNPEYTWNFKTGGQTVNEPAVLGLVGLGLAGLALARRRG